jgi:hypothetical protein
MPLSQQRFVHILLSDTAAVLGYKGTALLMKTYPTIRTPKTLKQRLLTVVTLLQKKLLRFKIMSNCSALLESTAVFHKNLFAGQNTCVYVPLNLGLWVHQVNLTH